MLNADKKLSGSFQAARSSPNAILRIPHSAYLVATVAPPFKYLSRNVSTAV
jgi:hypothetical protein